MPPRTDRDKRIFTMAIDIAATPEDVWAALTDAGELMRWFPLQARVTPAKGGAVFWGWDDHWAWESAIDEWQPGRRLRLVESRPAFDAHGDPLPGPARLLAMEFTLETHAGKTTLRFVHSGFGEDASWDDELESVSNGWQFEFRSLRHYLEQHKGRDRHYAAAHRVTRLDRDIVWKRLFSPGGFAVTQGTLADDDFVVIQCATGEQLSGRVAWHNAGRDLFVRVTELSDGIFRVSTWRAAGQTGVQVWLTTYDPQHADRVRAFATEIQPVVDRLLQ